MEEKKHLYWTLFASTFRLSAFTFGGGFVIIPLMRRQFVTRLGWVGEEEMLDMTAIAQSSPGAIAVNASILLGYRVAGIPGALITVLGTVLPPLIILSVISFFYAAFRSNPVVNLVMKAMNAAVAAVICDVVLTMGASVLKLKKAVPVVMLVCAFLAVRVLHVNIVVIILVCGAVGALEVLWAERKAKGAAV